MFLFHPKICVIEGPYDYIIVESYHRDDCTYHFQNLLSENQKNGWCRLENDPKLIHQNLKKWLERYS